MEINLLILYSVRINFDKLILILFGLFIWNTLETDIY